MKLNFKISHLPLFLGAAVFSILLLSNCEDKPLDIGLDLLPEDELLDVVDSTFSVELYTISDEPLYTRSLGSSPLGVINDTVIGIFETEYITDFIYDREVSFFNDEPENIVLLDIKLEINYQVVYGDSTSLNFNVYELLEPMPDYTNSDYQIFSHMYDPEPLNVGEPVMMDTETPTYEVTLSDDFGQGLIDANEIDTLMYDPEFYHNFKDYFKGLYFATEPEEEAGGGIVIVDHRTSKMILRTLEYNIDSLRWDTLSNIFHMGNPNSAVDTGGVHLNLYSNDLTPEVEGVIDNFEVLHHRAFINSLSGPRVLVKIPALEQLRQEYEGEISVNFAHLIIPFDPDIYNRDKDLYTPPNKLGVYDSGLNSPILDDQLAENHLGGDLDDENYHYQFNIGNHVNAYLRSEESIYSNSLYLFAAKGSPVTNFKFTPSRIILQQDSSINKSPKIRIVYSIIPK